MTAATFVPMLALSTLLLVAALGYGSKVAVERRRADPDAPKSALAKDGPSGD